MPEKTSTHHISLAGEFAVLSRLSFERFDANLTLARTKGIDILVSDPDTKVMSRVEVKTTHEPIEPNWDGRSWRGKHENVFGTGRFLMWMVHLPNEIEPDPRLFFCFVAIKGNSYRFFIVHSSEVYSYLEAQHKHWQERSGNEGNYGMRKFRLALNAEEVSDLDCFHLPTRTCAGHEDRWDLLRT